MPKRRVTIGRGDGSEVCARSRLHRDVPPLRIEPEIEVVVEKSGEPQQRQPRAGRDRVLRVDRDPLAHIQPERRPVVGRVLPTGDVRVQPDRRLPARDDLPFDRDVPEELPAGRGRSRPTRAGAGPAPRSRSCSRCPAGPGTSGCSPPARGPRTGGRSPTPGSGWRGS